MRINVSIVLYKTSVNELSECLSSFIDDSDINKVFLIDNYYTNTTTYELSNHKIRYIQTGHNIGFGAAHNIAIKKSIEEDIDFHLVLNSDTVLSQVSFSELILTYDSNPEFGIMIPKTIGVDGKSKVHVKQIPSPFDLIARLFKIHRFFPKSFRTFNLLNAQKSESLFAPYISGCFMFFSINKIRSIGLFDERFFLYPEDIDLSRRFAERFVNVQINTQTLIHIHRAESKRSIRLLAIHMFNIIQYFNKWGWIRDTKRKVINDRYNNLNGVNK